MRSCAIAKLRACAASRSLPNNSSRIGSLVCQREGCWSLGKGHIFVFSFVAKVSFLAIAEASVPVSSQPHAGAGQTSSVICGSAACWSGCLALFKSRLTNASAGNWFQHTALARSGKFSAASFGRYVFALQQCKRAGRRRSASETTHVRSYCSL